MTFEALRRWARVLGTAAAVVLLLALALSEWRAVAERQLAGEGPVDVDVAEARADLAARLLTLESTCATIAEETLARTAREIDQFELFDALRDIPLPPGAGVHVEDRFGRILAWSGVTLDDAVVRAIPRDADGGRLFPTDVGRRIAVRRTRSSPVEGEPIVAFCHLPIEEHFAARSRFLTSLSMANEIEAQHRVGALEILAPGASSGEELPSAFGGVLARLVVKPLSPAAWRERVDQRAREHRALLLLLLTLTLGALAWWRAPEIAERVGRQPVWGHAGRAAIVIAARLCLAGVSLPDALPASAIADPGTYNAGWLLGLGGSPLDVLLTTLAALGIAVSARGAADVGRRRPLPAPAFLGALVAVTLAARFLVGALIADAASGATVQVFAPDRVLPGGAGAAIFGSFVFAGAAGVLLLEALWRHAAPVAFATARIRIGACVVLAVLLSPVGLSNERLDAYLALVGVLGFGAALAASAFGRGAAARAAAIPLGVAIGVFAPAQHELIQAARADVEQEVAARDAGSDDDETRGAELDVRAVLASLQRSDTLQDGLARRTTPPDLAARLWRDSLLAELPSGSGLEILPLSETAAVGFSAGLPPQRWLPDPTQFPGPSEQWIRVLGGRGAGSGGRWIVGETPIEKDGILIASARVWLQLRPPSAQGVPRLAAPEEMRTRDRPAQLPPMDSYDSEGRLVMKEAENPRRPGGTRLDEAVRKRVIDEGRAEWEVTLVGGEEVDVLLHPRRDESGEIDGAYVIAFAASSGRRMLLNATKASLFGALLSLLALAVSAPWWARGARLRFSYRLVISYALLAALPLVVLAWVNRELVRGREEVARQDSVRELVSALASTLHADDVPEKLAGLEPGDLDVGSGATDELKSEVYSPGYPQGLYLGAHLGLVTDHGLLGTPVMPPRIDGEAYLEVVLLERPFHVRTVTAETDSVEVGFAPLRSPKGEVIGALSVPVIREAWRREKQEVDAITTVAGFYLFSLVTVMLVGGLLARRLAAPLRSLREGTKRVASGDLSESVPPLGTGELSQVIDAFNGMMSDLAESRERLVRAEKEAAWRDMARQVAHEVKNPLTPMRLAAEHLRRAHEDEHPQFDQVLRRAVEVIIRQTEALRRIVTDFRDFARMPVQRRDPVDVSAVVTEVLALYRDLPNVTVDLNVSSGVPAVLADRDELRRVFVNICGNAVEAFDEQDGRLTARVVADATHVIATMVDDGPGIPADILPRLFEPSFSTKTGGTGLGLAICKRAVEDLGGSIEIESGAGVGTTVTIRIPHAPAGGAVEPPSSTLGPGTST